MMKKYRNRVREVCPLIHCITNYVTVNDCANILLACGASPIMADEPAEAAEITAICSGLVLNIGTLNQQTLEAMFIAGRKARSLHHPVIFDPVGAGASRFRTNAARKILTELHPDIVRCNISELKMLMNSGSVSRGVDASDMDKVTDANLPDAAAMLKKFAAEQNCVTAVSGAMDLIASPDGRCCAVRNGHPIMAQITGSGCMLSTVTAAYAAASPEELFEASAAAFCDMGIAGEHAFAQLRPEEGNSTFRNRLIDAFCKADSSFREEEMRYEMF